MGVQTGMVENQMGNELNIFHQPFSRNPVVLYELNTLHITLFGEKTV